MSTRSKKLMDLPYKKIAVGLRRLQDAGITPTRWLKMLNTKSAAMERIVNSFPGSDERVHNGTGLIYDSPAVSRILGLPCECHDTPPEAGDGEIVIYYGGWDLITLRHSPAGLMHMKQDALCEEKGWKGSVTETGFYRIILRTPHSEGLNWNEQKRLLATTKGNQWQAAPVAVAATALLILLADEGRAVLSDDAWYRCAEPVTSDEQVALRANALGLSALRLGNKQRFDGIWLTAVRKC